jgi:membrane protein DedA with SNARE-associated domain
MGDNDPLRFHQSGWSRHEWPSERMELFEQIWNAIRTATLPDLGVWSYVILFILVFIEGPAITMTAGAMAGAGILRFDLVFIVAVVGNTMADFTWYLLGYFGGHRSILFRLRWIRQNELLIERLSANIHQQSTKLFMLTKASVGFMSIPVLLASGIARVPWYRLFLVSLIFEPLWNGVLIVAGYRLGDYIAELDRGLRVFALIGSIALFIVLANVYRRIFLRITKIDDIVS